MDQSEHFLGLVDDWEDPMPKPVVQVCDGIHVVRDDLLEAGSKARFADKLVRDTDVKEFVYGGSNKVGWGNISLAWLCRKYGKRAVSLYAARKEPSWHQKKYLEFGGEIVWVKMGMLTVTMSRARKYAAEDPTNRMNVPIGLEHELVLGSIVKVARNLDIVPEVVWTVGSSGTLTRGLQLAWSGAQFNAVQTGHKMNERESGSATVWQSGYKYEKACREQDRPPFPSAPEYDAKVWKVMMDNYDKSKVNLFWNVAA